MRPTLAYLEVLLGTEEPLEGARGSDGEVAGSALDYGLFLGRLLKVIQIRPTLSALIS